MAEGRRKNRFAWEAQDDTQHQAAPSTSFTYLDKNPFSSEESPFPLPQAMIWGCIE